jgi:hypothetical protein
MKKDGPELELLMRRMTECPPVFLGEPSSAPAGSGGVVTAALVQDLILDLKGSFLTRNTLKPFLPSNRPSREESNRLRLVQIACRLFSHEWFHRHVAAEPVFTFLAEGLSEFARVVSAEAVVRDPDRTEEFIRTCLAALEICPHGETAVQAADRLQTLDSGERLRLIKEARAAEERAKKIREEMARKAAQEAAATYGRE